MDMQFQSQIDNADEIDKPTLIKIYNGVKECANVLITSSDVREKQNALKTLDFYKSTLINMESMHSLKVYDLLMQTLVEIALIAAKIAIGFI